MRPESEINKRINELVDKIKFIKTEKDPSNYLTDIDKIKEQLDYLTELRHLYWVLEKPVPVDILTLIK